MSNLTKEITKITTAKLNKLLKEQTSEYDTKIGRHSGQRNIDSRKYKNGRHSKWKVYDFFTLLNNGDVWVPEHRK